MSTIMLETKTIQKCTPHLVAGWEGFAPSVGVVMLRVRVRIVGARRG